MLKLADWHFKRRYRNKKKVSRFRNENISLNILGTKHVIQIERTCRKIADRAGRYDRFF